MKFFGHLRQNTANQTRTLGTFYDDTDFLTPESALTVANTDIKLRKMGADARVDKNSGGLSLGLDGAYKVTWNATDTNVLGELHVYCKVAGATPVEGSYWVLSAESYDAIYGAGTGFDSAGRVNLGAIRDGQVPTPAVTGIPDVNVTLVADSTADVAGFPTLIDTILTAVSDGFTALPTNVLNQVNAGLDASIPELIQAIPGATPSLRQAAMLGAMAIRNRIRVNRTAVPNYIEWYNDAGTMIFRKPLSDNGTVYEETKAVIGV